MAFGCAFVSETGLGQVTPGPGVEPAASPLVSSWPLLPLSQLGAEPRHQTDPSAH